MKLPRLQIGTLMVLVAIVGIDLAAGRGYLRNSDYFGWNLLCLIAVVPIGVVLEIVIVRLIHRRGRDLVYWVGFLAGGAGAMASIVWALADPSYESVYTRPEGVVRSIYPGCFASQLWNVHTTTSPFSGSNTSTTLRSRAEPGSVTR